MGKKKVHIVTYTHWDREFRWEFERTRMRLVDCIDGLLDIMENDEDYKSFLFDGQLTLIEDYLEIRPENKDRIIKLAKEGRLEIGPWYTLADCSPIQGESVVRNLMYGYRKSQEYGNVLKCGYNVFSFGQIGQLPQIYANFNIDTILFYKYMDPKKSKYHEFIWEAPDGTKALASRLGKEARWNFFFAGHIPIVYDKDAWDMEWKYNWGELGKVFHTADPKGYGWFYDILDPETSFHKENIRKGMDRALKTVEGTAAPETVLMFEGTDFTEPHPLTTEIIKEIKNEYKDEIEVVHSTLTDYLDELKEALKDKEDLDVVKGPMRDGPVGAIHTDVYSIHPEVMIENSHAENIILRYAEPLSTFAWKYNLDKYPKTYLNKIWKLMFESHAHDSMHGLGPKTLAEGEIARIKQANIIAQGLERKGLENITKEIDTSQISDSEYFLAVHNPASFKRNEVVEAYIDVPSDARLDYLIIEDLNGEKVQIQEVERKETRAGIYHPRSRNMPFYCQRVHVYFAASNIPAMGYKTYKIKWAQKNEYPYPHEDWAAPRILDQNMLYGTNMAQNEYIKVFVKTDGTVDITDKKTGKVFTDLNYLLDSGDKGNMWMSDVPGNDKTIASLGREADVSVTTNGPLVVKFEVNSKIKLPCEFDWTNNTRSNKSEDLFYSTEYTLRKGCKYLEVNQKIKNTVRDHYLKVCFPTDIDTDKTYTEGSFMVTEFSTKPSINGELRGNELARHPAQLWYGLSNNEQGFSVLTDATKDYEVLENDDRNTLAMGLVRSVRLRIPCDNRLWMEYPGDESSQSLNEFEYRYALIPHQEKWDKANLYNEGLAFNAQVKACQFGKQKGIFKNENSFVELIGKNLILSSIKKAEDRDTIIVRLYNPTENEIEGKLNIGIPFKKGFNVTLNEKRMNELQKEDNCVSFKAGKGKIISIEID